MAAPTSNRKPEVWIAAATSPTVAEKAPTYREGDLWLRRDTGKVWMLADDGAGTWTTLN